MNSLFKNVALARLLVVEEFAPAATVLDELAVAVDVGVEMAELPEQCALGLGVAGIEFPHLGGEQIVKKSERFLARSAGGAFGSKPRRPSASPRDTSVQPVASA